jgi:hypothetical protein
MTLAPAWKQRSMKGSDMAEDQLKKTAHCGLYCGDCSFDKGTIPDLARDLRKAHIKNLRAIRKSGVDEWAAAGKRLWYSPAKKK